ncbi:MAG: G5 domain-containing protein [Armatimonadetes bacterium]|nr:G5 domain-containing protein [Armatimonadota bacterium]
MRLGKIVGVLCALLSTNLVWGKGSQEIKTEQKTESKSIPFPTKYELSRDVGKGRMVTKKKGTPGTVLRTYEVITKFGKAVSKRLVSTTRSEPVAEIIAIGSAGYTNSNRGGYTRSKVVVMEATAYHPYEGSSTGSTATGISAKFGVVAVDPRVIKLGTMVFVEGYGFAIAADTGGAIKGNKIDLCMLDKRAIYNFGRRKVRVHILSKR